MMEQDQLSRLGGGGNLTSHRHCRVSVSLRGWESRQLSAIMFLQILRVVDQHIRIARKLNQLAIRADVAFGIRRVHNRLAVPRDAIDIDSAGMRIRFVNADDDRLGFNADKSIPATRTSSSSQTMTCDSRTDWIPSTKPYRAD